MSDDTAAGRDAAAREDAAVRREAKAYRQLGTAEGRAGGARGPAYGAGAAGRGPGGRRRPLRFGRLVAGAARDPRQGPPPAARAVPAVAGARRTRRGVRAGEREQAVSARATWTVPRTACSSPGPATARSSRECSAGDGRAARPNRPRSFRCIPHDAAIVLDTADVDAVVVDAAAGSPGGPVGVPGRSRHVRPRRRAARSAEIAAARGPAARPAGATGPRRPWPSLSWDAVPDAGTAPGRLAGMLRPAPGEPGTGPSTSSSVERSYRATTRPRVRRRRPQHDRRVGDLGPGHGPGRWPERAAR